MRQKKKLGNSEMLGSKGEDRLFSAASVQEKNLLTPQKKRQGGTRVIQKKALRPANLQDLRLHEQ